MRRAHVFCFALVVCFASSSLGGETKKDEFVVAAPIKRVKPSLIGVMLDARYRLVKETESQIEFQREQPGTHWIFAVEYTFLEQPDRTSIRWSVYQVFHKGLTGTVSRVPLGGWQKTVLKWLEKCRAQVESDGGSK